MFCHYFTPYVLKILRNYHWLTKGTEASGLKGVPKEQLADGDDGNEIAVDSSILQHSLDILCTLLKNTNPNSQEQ